METFDGQARNLDEGPGLLQSAWRYRWVVVTAALLGALLGYGWEARQPTLYQGVSSLYFTGTGDAQLPREDAQRFLGNQVALIRSWPVLGRAAKASPGTPLALLNRRMSAEISKEADLITIRVLAPTPQEAKRLADAVGTAYDDFVKQSSRDAARAEISQLEAAMRELSGKLVQLDAAIQASAADRSLQAKHRAVEEQLDATAKRSQLLATQAKVGTSRVALQQEAVIPLWPAQPSPMRGAAAGLLVGLVGSATLAWWLNSRRATRLAEANQGRAPVGVGEGWSAQPEPDPQGRAAGWADGARAAGNGNGGQRSGIGATLAGWVTGKGPTDPNAVQGTADAAQQQADPGSRAWSDRQGAVNIPVEVDENGLRNLLARLEATMGDEPIGWYLDNVPQRAVEQLTTNVQADAVALLLDNARGQFEVAGDIGLTAEERAVVVDADDDGLQEALRQGVGVFQDDNPVSAAGSLPGSRNAEALVVVPLADGWSWLGTLVVGRGPANGDHVATFSDPEIERIILYATHIAPTLQALLLLHRLQEGPLRTLDTSSSDPDAGTHRRPR
jgi:capsular polysaccharide biosynthesis protein